jgi:hypothetical protein
MDSPTLHQTLGHYTLAYKACRSERTRFLLPGKSEHDVVIKKVNSKRSADPLFTDHPCFILERKRNPFCKRTNHARGRSWTFLLSKLRHAICLFFVQTHVFMKIEIWRLRCSSEAFHTTWLYQKSPHYKRPIMRYSCSHAVHARISVITKLVHIATDYRSEQSYRIRPYGFDEHLMKRKMRKTKCRVRKPLKLVLIPGISPPSLGSCCSIPIVQ